MTKAQPIGFWMNAAEAPKDVLLQVASRSHARSHTVANGVGTADEIYQAAAADIDEEPIILVREDIGFDQDYRNPKYDPSSYAASVAQRLGGRKHLYWQVWNEPVFTSAAELTFGLNRAVALMHAIADRGYRFSIGGWAMASTWQQAVIDSGLCDNYLREVGELTNAGHGVENDHEYVYGSSAHSGGGYCCTDMLDPEKLKRENWPTAKAMQFPGTPIRAQAAEDLDPLIAMGAAEYLLGPRALEDQKAHFRNVTGQTPEQYLQTHARAQDASANWLMMRDVWKDLRCEKMGYKKARRIKGEATHDDLPNARVEGWAQLIEQRCVGGAKLRGVLDQMPLFACLFPWAGGEDKAYIAQLEWIVEVKQSNVLAWHLFCLNFNAAWTSFNLLRRASFWPVYYDMADRLSAQGVPPVSTLPPVPKPTAPGAPVLARLQSGYNLRTGNGTAYSVIRAVAANELVKFYPDASKPDRDTSLTRRWVWVEAGASAGWMASESQFLRLVPASWPNQSVQLAVPFVSQRLTGLNNCGPAALTSVLQYVGIKASRSELAALPIADVIAEVGNNGAFSSLDDLIRAAAHWDVSANKAAGSTLAALRAELDAGRPVIALVTRGLLPGAQDYYAFTGNHFVVVVGYTPEKIVLLDPLKTQATDGILSVYVNDFAAAWQSLSSWLLKVDPSEFVPAPAAPFTPEQVVWLDARYVRK